ncbi:unnamed protein product [Cuscuta campestris]|uniref:RNA helicase n=1 Tax=Cuscuta campestris TaxID=132261 RepID=A0A484LQK0_9ASTE|nr:unnamed protein product [Cuscuta campestris]
MRKNRKAKTNSNSKLLKSQKKKLARLKEDKEKAALLSKSLETLAKYKIEDDSYSLLSSSRNLGQVETTRDKRRREVQYSKAGLVVPGGDPPLKKNKKSASSISCDIEQEFDETKLHIPVVNDYMLQPPVTKIDTLSEASGLETCKPRAFDGDSATPVRDVANEKTDLLRAEDLQNPMPTPSYSDDETKRIKPGIDIKQNADLTACPPQRSLLAPTVVHVTRPKEVEEKRKDLPIVMMEQEIMEAINENTCVIICGETGCGKTTQVPQFLYEAGFGLHAGRGGIIGVTQPRRVAVLATAKRVAFELGFHLGKEVGFQVRHDRKVGNNCSIKFMTDGILLREVQNDFLLRRYSVIILDEAHERSLNTDILVGMLSRVIRLRQHEFEEQQKRVLSGHIISSEEKIYPLKLVLMSATLRVEDFVASGRVFHDPPPVIEVPTRQYPVTTHFSKRTEIVDYVGQAYKKVLSIHKRLPAGGILVFVTGQREVEFLCRKLRQASKDIVKKNGNLENESLPILRPGEENDMEEISEAFEVNKSSNLEITERFNSYNEDYPDACADESDCSFDSEDDSDLEYSSDFDDQLNQNPLESDGILDSLKAAFDALSAKKALVSNTASETNTRSVPPCVGPMCVLPLYAMLPASAQLRVFEEVKEGERLVVVATNVAETSLTIPGIKYVVDTGREKVKKYNLSNGMEMFEVQWISKASASQRAGRAGRTGPGHCYRLYSSAVFNDIFAPFSDAEILKVPVDGVVLLMKSMHIDKVTKFPFPTPPEATALTEAERCLKFLQALDVNGWLTPIGKAMARFPMSPRHSRMLLTVIQTMQKVKDYKRSNTVLAYAVAAVAALSLSNPFIVQFEQPVISGFQMDPNGEGLEDFSWGHGTIEDVEASWKDCSGNHKSLQLNEEEILGQAIFAGWPDRVARRIKRVSGLSQEDLKATSVRYQACMVTETVFLHRRSAVSKSAPEFLVYSELMHSKRPYIHGATRVEASWLVKYGQSMCHFSAPLSDPKPFYNRLTDEVLCWVKPTFGTHLWELPLHSRPLEGKTERVTVFACALLEGKVLPCLKPARKFMAAPPGTILRPEASGVKRVGNLLSRMKSSKAGRIDSRVTLEKVWETNPKELFGEIMDWFQEGFHEQFESLWEQMLFEVRMDPRDFVSKKKKKVPN